MDSKEVALREIRELILINGSYDVYLVAQIDKILDRAIPPIGVKANASSSKEAEDKLPPAKQCAEWRAQAADWLQQGPYIEETDDDLRRT